MSPQGLGVGPPGPVVPASEPPPAPVDEHTPPVHDRPALHATPPQQVCPSAPQGAGIPPERRVQAPR